ncbi:hypothetical protein HK102_003226 [Quaeritorhiza haematococci]|nr:hypothetical protein HK102_003226 [Quaeritorhiza haematococci]
MSNASATATPAAAQGLSLGTKIVLINGALLLTALLATAAFYIWRRKYARRTKGLSANVVVQPVEETRSKQQLELPIFLPVIAARTSWLSTRSTSALITKVESADARYSLGPTSAPPVLETTESAKKSGESSWDRVVEDTALSSEPVIQTSYRAAASLVDVYLRYPDSFSGGNASATASLDWTASSVRSNMAGGDWKRWNGRGVDVAMTANSDVTELMGTSFRNTVAGIDWRRNRDMEADRYLRLPTQNTGKPSNTTETSSTRLENDRFKLLSITSDAATVVSNAQPQRTRSTSRHTMYSDSGRCSGVDFDVSSSSFSTPKSLSRNTTEGYGPSVPPLARSPTRQQSMKRYTSPPNLMDRTATLKAAPLSPVPPIRTVIKPGTPIHDPASGMSYFWPMTPSSGVSSPYAAIPYESPASPIVIPIIQSPSRTSFKSPISPTSLGVTSPTTPSKLVPPPRVAVPPVSDQLWNRKREEVVRMAKNKSTRSAAQELLAMMGEFSDAREGRMTMKTTVRDSDMGGSRDSTPEGVTHITDRDTVVC